MAVVKLQRFSLCGLNTERKGVLERLQAYGMLEIHFRKKDQKGLKKMDTQPQRANFEKEAAMADTALSILDKYAPEKKSLLDSFAGKDVVKESVFQEAVSKQDEFRASIARIIKLDKQVAENKSEIAQLENQIESLVPWMALDMPMDTAGTDTTAVMLGTFPAKVTAEEVLAACKTHNPPAEAVDITQISADKDAVYAAVLCLKEEAPAVEEVLRELGFAKPSVCPPKTPAKRKEEALAGIASCQQRIENLTHEIADMAASRQDICLISDYYRLRADKYEALGQLPQTKHTFAISGYVPAEDAEKLKKDLEGRFTVDIEIEEMGPKEKPPVLLRNNKFSSAFEGVVKSFGLPKKDEFDPTAIMSVFYFLLFGLMLSDAAYGALISIACGFIILKFPRMDPGLRKSIQMFFWCGISTLFWGIMFGGYFGDLVNVVSREWFGHEVEIPALWFVPLNEPMRMLIYSFVFGLIHLFVGLGLKGYLLLKKKDIVGFVCDIVAWYLFLIGLILILLPTDIFYSMSQMEFNFPDGVKLFSKVIAVVGAVIILVMAGRRKKKKIPIRLALGLYDIYGITSWLSDILSYSRLLALGLATGVIAQVINQIGSMFGTGVIGTIFFIVVFIVGHILNMAINILGAYVHTNRLQYVEFFGKFYDGGGRPFTPFKMETKYVDIEEVQSL